jgi:hypothetical protein
MRKPLMRSFRSNRSCNGRSGGDVMSKKKKNVSEAAEEKNDDFLAQEAKEMEEQAPNIS